MDRLEQTSARTIRHGGERRTCLVDWRRRGSVRSHTIRSASGRVLVDVLFEWFVQFDVAGHIAFSDQILRLSTVEELQTYLMFNVLIGRRR